MTMKIEELVISKEQLVDAVRPFIEEMGRLPYMREDSITVKVDDKERLYKSHKYIKGYFDSHQDMTEYLFGKGILTYKFIGEVLDLEPKRVEELMSGKAKKVKNRERRMIDLFINEDLYEHLGHATSKHCRDCTKEKKCGQPYWVDVVTCANFRKSKRKKK